MIQVPQKPPVNTSQLRSELVEYLLAIDEYVNFKYCTLELTLDMAVRYLQQKQPESHQLVLLTALFIASKLHEIEAFSLDLVHKFSDHSYTSREILKCEHAILTAIGFEMFNQKNELNQYTELLLGVVMPLMPRVKEDVEAVFLKTLHSVQKLLLRFPPLGDCKALGPAIIVAALIILSQSNGRFPVICRLSKLSGVSEQDINLLSMKVLKSVLGRQFYKKLNL